MIKMGEKPRIFHILQDEAVGVRKSAYGSVGELFSGEGIEAVWVKKEAEDIDPEWFSQPTVDLIFVVHGKLKVEYEREDFPPCVLEAGDMLVLPAEIRCRAYHWPRDHGEAAVFIAIYPKQD